MRRPHARPRRRRFRPRLRRFELGKDSLQRVETRRERVAGIVDRVPQVLCQRGCLVVGKVEGPPARERARHPVPLAGSLAH